MPTFSYDLDRKPALAAYLRTALAGHSQPDIAAAGGPSSTIQSEILNDKREASPLAVDQFADALRTLHPGADGERRALELLAINRLLSNAPDRNAQAVELAGYRIRFNAAAADTTMLGNFELTSLHLAHYTPVSDRQQHLWMRAVQDLVTTARLTFVQRDMFRRWADVLDTPFTQFRAGTDNEPSLIALDPLTAMGSYPVPAARRALTRLSADGSIPSVWSAVFLATLVAEQQTANLPALYNHEAPPFDVVAGVHRPLPAEAEQAWRELQRLFMPLRDAIVEAMGGAADRMQLASSAITTVRELLDKRTVLFDRRDAGAVALLATLAIQNHDPEAGPRPWPIALDDSGVSVLRALYDDEPARPGTMTFVPGTEAIAIIDAPFYGKPVAVRVC